MTVAECPLVLSGENTEWHSPSAIAIGTSFPDAARLPTAIAYASSATPEISAFSRPAGSATIQTR